MEFLAINRPRPDADSEQLTAMIPAHLRWVDHGLRTGELVRADRWGHGGMCLVEAPDGECGIRGADGSTACPP